MPRLIKRYANRKLYDPTERRYVTLEGLAELVAKGEEVKIIDKKTGEDITGVVLSKVLTEQVADGKGAPASLLANLIQRRSDAVMGYVKQSLAAGVKTVKDVEEQLQQQWRRVTGSGSSGDDLKSVLNRMIEDTVQFLLTRMNLPTRSEIEAINKRLDEIEQQIEARRSKSGKKRSS
ncbi:MAG: polyhydroxyalkanoate synthesis regulator DNA-binding domain-containing protein [Acidobacteriota bacterium]|nr:phasin family protein [Blastocatellia bacterium]MDW8413054.1 polyhydroxyalkanoate synthesis regulator DNA-binding domain-containing protein [Acidobacteriota bacterium]